MSIPFAVLQLDHVVLRSADPARLEDFYVRVLGCPVEKRQDTIGLTQLRAGRALIDILALKPGETATGSAKGNMDHLCLRIEPFDAVAIHSAPQDTWASTSARSRRALAPTAAAPRSTSRTPMATVSS